MERNNDSGLGSEIESPLRNASCHCEPGPTFSLDASDCGASDERPSQPPPLGAVVESRTPDSGLEQSGYEYMPCLEEMLMNVEPSPSVLTAACDLHFTERMQQEAIDRGQGQVNQLGGSYLCGRPLPLHVRKQIVDMATSGIKPIDVSRRLRVSHGCVSKILKHHQMTGSVIPSMLHGSRPRVVTSHLKQLVLRIHQQDALLSLPDIRQKLLSGGWYTPGNLPSQASVARALKSSRLDQGSATHAPCGHVDCASQRPDGDSTTLLCKRSGAHRRSRTRFNTHQKALMEASFYACHFPDEHGIQHLASLTGINKKVVQVWFCNRRAKWRRVTKSGVSKDTLRQCHEAALRETTPASLVGDRQMSPDSTARDVIHQMAAPLPTCVVDPAVRGSISVVVEDVSLPPFGALQIPQIPSLSTAGPSLGLLKIASPPADTRFPNSTCDNVRQMEAPSFPAPLVPKMETPLFPTPPVCYQPATPIADPQTTISSTDSKDHILTESGALNLCQTAASPYPWRAQTQMTATTTSASAFHQQGSATYDSHWNQPASSTLASLETRGASGYQTSITTPWLDTWPWLVHASQRIQDAQGRTPSGAHALASGTPEFARGTPMYYSQPYAAVPTSHAYQWSAHAPYVSGSQSSNYLQ